MKILLLSIFMLCMGMDANAQLYWDWAKMGNNSQSIDNYMLGAEITVDDNGNVYIAGTVSDTILIGNTLIKPRPIGDALIIKYDKDGVVLWAKLITGTYNGAVAKSVAVAPNGDVYVAGLGRTPLYADNITIQGQSMDAHNLFLVRMDANGNFIWVKTSAGPSGWSHHIKNHLLAVDDDNNIYMSTNMSVGSYYCFDTTLNLPYGGSGIIKFDMHGDVKWRKVWLGNYIWGTGMGGAEVKICTNGDLVYALPLQRDEVINNSHTIYNNLIIGKLDSDGNEIWHTEFGDTLLYKWQFGGAGYDIDIDKQENIYLWGSYSKAYKVGTGPNSSSNGSGFLAKFSTNGDLLWSNFVSGQLAVFAIGVACHNATAQTLCLGNFLGSITVGSYNISSPSAGTANIFVTAYNTDGNIEWLTTIGGALQSTIAYGSALNNTSNTFAVTGYFKDSTTFGPLGLNAGSFSQQDIFTAVAKFDTLTTSIPMQLAGFDFNVYPNPVSNVLSVELQNSLQPMDVMLLDVNGAVVYSSPMQHGKILIPVTELPDGQYLLGLKQGDVMVGKSVVIHH